VRYILPTLCQAAELIAAEKPDVQFVLPIAQGLDRSLIDGIVKSRPITVVTGETYNAVRYARAAMVASGTATLETALLGTPEVIVYRISAAAWFLGKFLLRVRLFGIVNIILGEEVVPELFQDKFTAEAASKMTLRLMDDVWMQSKIRGNYEQLRRQLGKGNVAAKVVDAVADAVERRVPANASLSAPDADKRKDDLRIDRSAE
jgi:lipid-A-disaccharide synthase